ncbi:endopeptidase [Streptomyces resistomycificus]|uniref:Serine protease n=1 Tax=Streptomyces resistomycificus TaxID=67356 RepID=A0A0L8LXK7_9ACTN|nr:endopeptidase [Streptomyces resistomycificus]KOG42824.1 endopeptidase [Streptomyces resistomycificus]KUN90748.1 endopeptidase [Streptomyces resistomycificus]
MTHDPHASVSNQLGETLNAPQEQTVYQEPSDGESSSGSNLTPDGSEKVSGYVRATPAGVQADEEVPLSTSLPDIGAASFGGDGASVETVHLPDDRAQITDTATYPWRVHCSLLVTAADNSHWIGTGWFIGPNTLITAGHVVYIKNSGVPGRDGWVRDIQVMPGRNGATLPYGSVTSTSFRSVKGWLESGDQNYDYGAISVPTQLGAKTGWFGFGIWPDAELLSTVGNISGYPGDTPSGTQWYAARGINSVNTLKVHYDIDTAGGQSGSAVYRELDGKRYGFAIHAYGGTTTNSGTRITKQVYDNLVAWKA